jgi:uncharacterized membrane protein
MFKTFKYLTICVMLLNSMQSFSHGDEDEHPPEPPVPFEEEYFNDVIFPIVQENCTSCHNENMASGGHSFDTPDEIKSHGQLIYDSVINSRMPFGNKEWRSSKDAKILLYWASKQEDDGHHEE